jgi:hypothetical protein
MSLGKMPNAAWGRAVSAPLLLGGSAIALIAILALWVSPPAIPQTADSEARRLDPRAIFNCDPREDLPCAVRLRDEVHRKADELRARLKQFQQDVPLPRPRP